MIVRAALAVAVLALSTPVAAHPDHDAARPGAHRSIAEKAQDAVLVQIARSKLHARWRTAIPGRPESGAVTWSVPFRQPKGGETLIVKLTDTGAFISAAVESR